jgi:hypothetical protein
MIMTMAYMIRRDLVAVRIVGIPGVFGNLADADHVDIQEIGHRLEVLHHLFGIIGAGCDVFGHWAVLQGNVGGQGFTHGAPQGAFGHEALALRLHPLA